MTIKYPNKEGSCELGWSSEAKKGCNANVMTDRSTVNYFLSSVYCFGFLHDFRIHEHSELYSDVHCSLSLTLSDDCQTISKKTIMKTRCFQKKVRNCDSRKAEKYLENFDILRVAEIETLNQVSSKVTFR